MVTTSINKLYFAVATPTTDFVQCGLLNVFFCVFLFIKIIMSYVEFLYDLLEVRFFKCIFLLITLTSLTRIINGNLIILFLKLT